MSFVGVLALLALVVFTAAPIIVEALSIFGWITSGEV